MSARMDQLNDAMRDLSLDDSHIFRAFLLGALSNHVPKRHWERALTLARDVVAEPVSGMSLVQASEPALTL